MRASDWLGPKVSKMRRAYIDQQEALGLLPTLIPSLPMDIYGHIFTHASLGVINSLARSCRAFAALVRDGPDLPGMSTTTRYGRVIVPRMRNGTLHGVANVSGDPMMLVEFVRGTPTFWRLMGIDCVLIYGHNDLPYTVCVNYMSASEPIICITLPDNRIIAIEQSGIVACRQSARARPFGYEHKVWCRDSSDRCFTAQLFPRGPDFVVNDRISIENTRTMVEQVLAVLARGVRMWPTAYLDVPFSRMTRTGASITQRQDNVLQRAMPFHVLPGIADDIVRRVKSMRTMG